MRPRKGPQLFMPIHYSKYYEFPECFENRQRYYPNDSLFTKELCKLLFPEKFVREFPVICQRYYQMDFAHVANRINIEVDGLNHLTKQRKITDTLRDKRLNRYGWSVVRLVRTDKSFNRGPIFGPHWDIVVSVVGREAAELDRIQGILAAIRVPKPVSC
jgi:very-short-patch-repair endonuclease